MENVSTLSYPDWFRRVSRAAFATPPPSPCPPHLHILKFPGDQTKRSIKLYQATPEKKTHTQRERQGERGTKKKIYIKKKTLQQTHFSQIVN